MQVNIPIGKIIQEEVFQMNISLQELSERVFIHKETLLLLFNCKTMDINILYRWCCLLRIDFFTIYSKTLMEDDDCLDKETIRINDKVKILKYENKL